ncbi:MAG: hypothetical protein U5K79_08980 [Cyclobacteriaceae bacterium]|nr:hypothetical protein [Cyclobacteriaceae bacterium]
MGVNSYFDFSTYSVSANALNSSGYGRSSPPDLMGHLRFSGFHPKRALPVCYKLLTGTDGTQAAAESDGKCSSKIVL